MNDWTFPYRVTVGLVIFSALLLYERRTNPNNPRRPKEYAFLFGATAFAMLYGALHDFITWSISRDYFVYGKKIPAAAERFFPEVMQLGMTATWSVGLLCAALALMANNPDNAGRQLPYPRLLRLSLLPLPASIAAEATFGVVAARYGDALIEYFTGHIVTSQRAFLAVWAMHLGAYLGVIIGLAVALPLIVKKKRELPSCTLEPTASSQAPGDHDQ